MDPEQMSHTPGPWRCVHMEHRSYIVANTKIADVFSTAFRDRANQEANAHLMAAAPDLIEACKEALRSSEADDGGGYVWLNDLLTAAIAKAEGK